MRTYLRAFQLFCSHFKFPFFPVTKATYLAYLAFLSQSLKSFSSVRNYLSILSHINKSFSYSCAFIGDYDTRLANRAVRRLLGDFTARKHAMSVDILLQISRQFDPGNVFHTCMAALFLVAFFSFLRISNLVPRTLGDLSHHSPLFLRRSSVKFSARGAVLSVTRTKTLQINQRILEIPLPLIPGSPLCPVSALSAYLQRVPAEPFSPLFGVYINNQYQPILAHHYNSFVKRAVSSLGLDPTCYSSHSFRRGGASFAFNNRAPTEFIKSHGDWLSDAYLVYLTMSNDEKFKILDSITTKLRHTH